MYNYIEIEDEVLDENPQKFEVLKMFLKSREIEKKKRDFMNKHYESAMLENAILEKKEKHQKRREFIETIKSDDKLCKKLKKLRETGKEHWILDELDKPPSDESPVTITLKELDTLLWEQLSLNGKMIVMDEPEAIDAEKQCPLGNEAMTEV